ncbi:hypothetical protein [Thermoflexus sp.]|jgi:hypothetical protein|uniref:hypothetical protein n=1 Tax=Thermoflexus sp. TaxID=1969742 RepID=UPI003BFAD513
MHLVYAPSKHLIVREVEGSPGEASERVIAAIPLPQAVATWSSFLGSGRFLEIKALPFPVQNRPVVRVRTSAEVLPRDISLLLSASLGQEQAREPAGPKVFPIANGDEDPDLVRQVASLSRHEGQWTVEIWDLNAALPMVQDRMEALKREGYIPTHLGIRLFAGPLNVTTGVGVVPPHAGDFWLSVGRKHGTVDLFATLVDMDDSSRAWELTVDASAPLIAVAMAFEKLENSAALNLVAAL